MTPASLAPALIGDTCAAIQAGRGQGRRMPWNGCIERYSPGFEAVTGRGDIGIWMPAVCTS